MQGSCHKWREEGGYGGSLSLHSVPKIWLKEIPDPRLAPKI